jgi:hypothetical protein
MQLPSAEIRADKPTIQPSRFACADEDVGDFTQHSSTPCHVGHDIGARSKLRVGITGSNAQTNFAERSQIIHIVPDEGGVRGGK